MPDKVAAKRCAYNAFIALHNHVEGLPQFDGAELKGEWQSRRIELQTAIRRHADAAGIDFTELEMALTALGEACHPFFVRAPTGVTDVDRHNATLAIAGLDRMRIHYCDGAVSTNRNGYAVPPCPNCGSDPAANGNVDDVCPGCGEWTYSCALIAHEPLGVGAETIWQHVGNPRWRELPPSEVRARQQRIAATPGALRWVWPLCLVGPDKAHHGHDAKAKVPLSNCRNLEYPSDLLFLSEKRPTEGQTFGVMIHDANQTQQQVGVGRLYYHPGSYDDHPNNGPGKSGGVE